MLGKVGATSSRDSSTAPAICGAKSVARIDATLLELTCRDPRTAGAASYSSSPDCGGPVKLQARFVGRSLHAQKI